MKIIQIIQIIMKQKIIILLKKTKTNKTYKIELNNNNIFYLSDKKKEKYLDLDKVNEKSQFFDNSNENSQNLDNANIKDNLEASNNKIIYVQNINDFNKIKILLEAR